MSSIDDLKPTFQNLLRPAVHGLAQAGITANQVTLAAMELSQPTRLTACTRLDCVCNSLTLSGQ
jgi:hypothetical protein